MRLERFWLKHFYGSNEQSLDDDIAYKEHK